MRSASPNKQYLDDGVYVDFDGYALVLTTENGVRVTNTIVLDPDVLCALFRYVTTFQAHHEEAHP